MFRLRWDGLMKILIGCEFSGIVRDAFTAKGHDVTSCDLLPTERPGKHYQGDIMDIINDGWDMGIFFPPCTDLSSSGAVYWPEKKKSGKQKKAIEFVLTLYNSDIPKIAIENPSGILSTIWRKPDQIIHPYYFGDRYMKRTCLWLKNLPLLYYGELFTGKVPPIARWHSGSTRGGKKKDGTRTKSKMPALKGDPKIRSLTFLGIAKAMADQWG